MNTRIDLIKFPRNSLKYEEGKYDLTNFLEKKIEVCEDIGRIKYIGKLIHTDGGDEMWVGIEWEDPERGKHNGTVGNYTYFKTLNEKGGSLIKFNKINFGITFLEATKYKYNFEDQNEIYTFLNKNVENELFIQANKKKINIEIIGKEIANKKFSEFNSIEHLDIAFSYINHIEPDLKGQFPKLKELILQKTLINNWSQFLELFISLPDLELLNFSENILNNFDQQFYDNKMKIISKPNCLRLSYLVMNKCQLDFICLKELGFLFGKLETLYLFGNNLNEITLNNNIKSCPTLMEDIKGAFENLTLISLEKNKIKNFLTVINFFFNEKLNKINLNQNSITRIYDSEQDLSILNKLKTNLFSLSLDYNQLLENIEILRDICLFSNLIDLDVLNNNSFNKLGIDNCKYQIIGRLPKLSTLNNTSISKEERRDYELLYLKNSVTEYFKLHSDTNNFNKETFEKYMSLNHPNYYLLVKKYYDPLEDIIQNTKTADLNTIKGNIIEITFQNDEKKVTKKFPKSTTFANLRNPMSKLFKLSSFNFYLNNEEMITDETKSLDNYGLYSDQFIYLK